MTTKKYIDKFTSLQYIFLIFQKNQHKQVQHKAISAKHILEMGSTPPHTNHSCAHIKDNVNAVIFNTHNLPTRIPLSRPLYQIDYV
jgi:hypothetical protein